MFKIQLTVFTVQPIGIVDMEMEMVVVLSGRRLSMQIIDKHQGEASGGDGGPDCILGIP